MIFDKIIIIFIVTALVTLWIMLRIFWRWLAKLLFNKETPAIKGFDDQPASKKPLILGCSAVAWLMVLTVIGIPIANRALIRGEDYNPTWSPDGKQIAFISARNGNQEIYIMNADGSAITRITDSPLDESDPDWSPDGTKIVFVYGTRIEKYQQIYWMYPDGSKQIRITTDNPAMYSSPDWSPDGTKIAFFGFLGNSEHIYMTNADGTELYILADNPAWEDSLDWSPDGTKIAFDMPFIYTNGYHGTEVGFINTDGSGITQLTYNSAWSTNPAWSPDGTQIAFALGTIRGLRHIYIMNSDATEQFLLPVPGNLIGDDSAWSPDGKRIAFTCYGKDFLDFFGLSLRDFGLYRREVCTINIDGTDFRQLTR